MIHMQMKLGEHLRLTLYGTSHGPSVGAIIEGIPKGLIVDFEALRQAMVARRPGGRYASKRREEGLQFPSESPTPRPPRHGDAQAHEW